MKYPESKRLAALPKKYDVQVKELESEPDLEELIAVEFSAGGKSWNLFIKDEYDDFDTDNQLVCIYLCLRALEDYSDCEDVNDWCKMYSIRPHSNVITNYHKQLRKTYQEIKAVIKNIDPCISAYDYEMRGGAYNELVEH